MIWMMDQPLERFVCQHDDEGTLSIHCEDCIEQELGAAEEEWWQLTSPNWWRWFGRRKDIA